MGKKLAVKPDNLSPILRTHMVEGENPFCKLFSDFHTGLCEDTLMLEVDREYTEVNFWLPGEHACACVSPFLLSLPPSSKKQTTLTTKI